MVGTFNQSLQCTQDVFVGFQAPSPPVFAGLKVVFLLRLVLTTVECSVRGGGLHGLDLRLLLAQVDDVDKLIGCGCIVCEISDLLPEMFRESAADEDCNVGVQQALATEFSDHLIVFTFACHEIFKFC